MYGSWILQVKSLLNCYADVISHCDLPDLLARPYSSFKNNQLIIFSGRFGMLHAFFSIIPASSYTSSALYAHAAFQSHPSLHLDSYTSQCIYIFTDNVFSVQFNYRRTGSSILRVQERVSQDVISALCLRLMPRSDLRETGSATGDFSFTSLISLSTGPLLSQTLHLRLPTNN